MARTLEQRTMRKVYLRLLPFTILTYFLCYLDRINVSFAALTMNKDLGLDPASFGMAAGMFYGGYCLFEVPSNIILEKLGARLWLARIMVSWGILSGATAFCTGPWSFVVVRFLLGLAEAGLYPGIVLFLTYWFPDRHRARIVAGFTLALPLAVAAGAPVSTALLGLNGVWGLAGWKWMYLFEAMPTVLIGVAILFYVTDRPAEAKWLAAEERQWLVATIAAERRLVEARRKIGLARSFVEPKVLLLALNFFGIVTPSLGMLLFVPQIVRELGFSTMQIGWVTMALYLCGAVSMVSWGWLSDRMQERRWNLFWACMVATLGLIVAGSFVGSWWSLLGLALATTGFYGTKGAFWAMPPMLLTGTAAASGIAWINSIGNLGGFVGPSLVGWAKTLTASFAGGLYVLAAFTLMSAAISLFALNIPRHAAAGETAQVPAE